MTHETAKRISDETGHTVEYAIANGEYVIWPEGIPCSTAAQTRAKIAELDHAGNADGETFRVGDYIEAGTGEDYDTGLIERFDGRMAFVAWDTGVKTPCPIDDLRHIKAD